jgi:hypothetical protein
MALVKISASPFVGLPELIDPLKDILNICNFSNSRYIREAVSQLILGYRLSGKVELYSQIRLGHVSIFSQS